MRLRKIKYIARVHTYSQEIILKVEKYKEKLGTIRIMAYFFQWFPLIMQTLLTNLNEMYIQFHIQLFSLHT